MTNREGEAVQARTHRIIAATLRIGLGIAAMLSVLAMVLGQSSLLAAGKPSLAFAGQSGVALAAATLSLIVLAVTPALRVVLLATLWARQRDWRFVLVALTVAGVLVISALLGRVG